jgi:predicted SAM-dependent methyltransferase
LAERQDFTMTRLIGINVGCGQTPTRDWINCDNSLSIVCARIPFLVPVLERIGASNNPTAQFIRFARDNEIKYANATKRIPLDTGTAHIVYSSHMLEHLDRQEARLFLAEAMRVLRPGGVLRLAVPDIRKLVQNYIATGDADEFIASTWMCAPRPRSLTESLRMLVLGPRHHNWMYDGTSLSKFLLSQGFVNPVELAAGQTTIPEPGDLDLFERHEESVYVEARKPCE